ncbi:MAG: GGDEF domain-containing protein [Clostridiales bacterium]|nr:GGDEF domain-containing protein [Clostridiales bacterium]
MIKLLQRIGNKKNAMISRLRLLTGNASPSGGDCKEADAKAGGAFAGLTGEADRAEFEEAVGARLAAGEETGCLLLIDVDRLREINGSYGREAGDAVLKDVFAQVRRTFGGCNYAGRLGSDEFALWLAGLSADRAGDIRREIALVNDRLLHSRHGVPPASVSVGGAFGAPGDDFKSLYKKAGGALYKVKVGGRCGLELSQG